MGTPRLPAKLGRARRTVARRRGRRPKQASAVRRRAQKRKGNVLRRNASRLRKKNSGRKRKQ